MNRTLKSPPPPARHSHTAQTARAWWQGAAIYQVYPHSFADSNGDGVGDLAGIAQHLDHIASLGVAAIWLSPFFTSPMKDFGYDISNFNDVDPVFGTLAWFTVARRGSNFAVTNPAMEVLFTVVPREDKYKAKNIIETFVYRGGDQVGAWVYRGLVAAGLSMAGISFVAVPLSAIWLALGLWLGWKQASLAKALTVPRPNQLSAIGPLPQLPLASPTRAANGGFAFL